MHKTPWTKQSSSLPSDRIKPTTKGLSITSKTQGKGKQNQPPEYPKSRVVRRLEILIEDVRVGLGRECDPKGGCFCLARLHELSSYTPLCRSCGLILCSVNLPQYCCPGCRTLLTTPASHASLILQLEAELASTIAKEAEEKERAIENARLAAGAFPTLSGSPARTPPPPVQPSYPMPSIQTHKVISLTGSKKSNKRVVVSSFVTKSATSSQPTSRDEVVDDEPERVRPSPTEAPHSSGWLGPNRPFENLIKGSIVYRSKPQVDQADSGTTKSSRRKRANNRIANDNDTQANIE